MELNIEDLKFFKQESKEYELLKERLKEKKAEFEEQNKALIQNLNNKFSMLESYKDELRVVAEIEFGKTGNKKLLGGLGIRQGISLKYDDLLALTWAKRHDLCLRLDKKQFEIIAKKQDIDGVIKEEKITVTFPKEIKFED